MSIPRYKLFCAHCGYREVKKWEDLRTECPICHRQMFIKEKREAVGGEE